MADNSSKGKDSVQCKICSVAVQKRSLLRHLQTHKEGRFLCDICGVYKANRKDALEGHKKVIHNAGGKSVNDCLFCKKKLVSPSAFEMHLRSHTRERPFFCKLCPNESTTAQNFKTHQGRIHPMHGKPSFHCHTCSKKFFVKKDLKRHIKGHNMSVKNLPFKCDVCSKALTSRAKLNIHKRVHSKEKPFPCEICNVAFSLVGDLNVHIRLHTGENPYSCTVCKRRFISSTNMKKHMRTHLREKASLEGNAM